MASFVFGQNNFAVRIENEKYVSSKVYSFDIMVYAVAPTTSWQFSGLSVGISNNFSWRNSGTITASLSNTEFTNPLQRPTAITYNTSGNRVQVASTTTVGIGNGTMITQQGLRYCTVTLTNTNDYATSSNPLLRWIWTGYPVVLNGYDATINALASFTMANNSTTISGQAFFYHGMYVNGTTYTGSTFTGLTSGGTTTLSAPVSSQDLVVRGASTPGTNVSCRSLNVLSSSSLTMGANTLDVGHTITNNGTLNLTGSSLTLSGNDGATQNQTLNLGTLSLVNLNFAGSGTKTLGATVNITGAVTGSGTATLNANGNLVLKSTATGTARIAELPSGASISGNYSVERYMPANRRFRLLASPVSGATAAHWMNFGANTPGVGTHITGSGGAANGFDPSVSNNPSAFSYNESAGNPSTSPDPGWQGFTSGTMTLNSGVGYRVLVRGDRQINPMINDPTRNTTTLMVTGTYPGTSSLTQNLSFTSSNGWNLLGNPFPSPISWNALTKSGDVSGTYYTYNTSSNAYVSWNGTTGSATDVIQSSQGFFVRATNSGASITFEESDKTSGTGGFFGKKTIRNLLSVTLIYDSANYDKVYLHFREDATNGLDDKDALKLTNPDVNLALIDADKNRLTIASMAMLTAKEFRVPISLEGTTPENYRMVFTGSETFNEYRVYLEDNKTSIIKEINEGYELSLSLKDAAERAEGRFYLVFKDKLNGETESFNEKDIKLFPNPANSKISNLQFSGLYLNSNKTAEVFDNTGKLIAVISIEAGEPFKEINLSNYAKGIYIIKINSDSANVIKRLVIE